MQDEAGLYLPLQDDEGLPLPIGPPWALQQLQLHANDESSAPAVVTTCSSSGGRDGLPDLLGYETVEEVVLPSGASVPCCVQLAGGLRGNCSAEMQRMARVVMESQASAQAKLQQECSPAQQQTQVGCDAAVNAVGISS
jgi:hypothetical protein